MLNTSREKREIGTERHRPVLQISNQNTIQLDSVANVQRGASLKQYVDCTHEGLQVVALVELADLFQLWELGGVAKYNVGR